MTGQLNYAVKSWHWQRNWNIYHLLLSFTHHCWWIQRKMLL